MPQGLTAAQLQQMGAKPVQSQPSGSGGLTLQQLQQMGAKPVGASAATQMPDLRQTPPAPSLLDKVDQATNLPDVLGGIDKSAVGALGGIGSLFEKGADAFTRNLGIKPLSETAPGPSLGENLTQFSQPTNTAQKIGKGIGDVAQLMAPTGLEEAGAGLAAKLAPEAPKLASGALKLAGKAFGGAAEFGGKTAVQTGGDAEQTKNAAIGGAILPVVNQALKTPLTMAAERIYQSALKPTGELADRIANVRTGLKERVFLTSGGVEKVAQKIDDLESKLGAHITSAADKGAMVSTSKMEQFVNSIRDAFKHNVDVAEAEKADKTITDMLASFKKKYGEAIPIEEAQKIKVASGQNLRKLYGQMTEAPRIEASKQMVRGLKEGILEKAPQVGDINSRLGKLYEFDKALEKAAGRVKNLNLLGMGGKLGAAVGGKAGAFAGALADLAEHSFVKSGAAIGLNDLATLMEKGKSIGQVPLNEIIRFMTKKGQAGQGQ